MSTLLTTSGSFIVTSGLIFRVITNKFWETGSLDGITKELPEALPNTSTEVDPKNPETKIVNDKKSDSKNILGGSVSPDGRWMALCDDRKQLTLWACEDWSLSGQWTLPRRANKIAFDKDSKALLVADKGGDVFRFDVTTPTSEGVCILGHLSMLLDVLTTSCGKYIISCDRDEKIRVSHFPNCYNIHNFCLGHTEFVTAIALCPHNPSLLFSASGDGSVRTWDFLSGTQYHFRLCSNDLTQSETILAEPENQNHDESSRVRRTQTPAIVALRCRKISDDESLVVITVDRFKGFLVYRASSQGELSFCQQVSTDCLVWDFKFDDLSGDLLVLISGDPEFLLRFQLSDNELSKVIVPLTQQSREELEKFFKAAKSSSGWSVDDLYKKWFDNLTEYMGRKEKRLESKKSEKSTELKPTEAKRIKL